jgi:protein-S-isoprenylcysteine O-methyltransferase Ste14
VELAVRTLDGLAALMMAALPAALLYWFLIHPLAAFWRRLGPAPSFAIVSVICLAVVYGIWTVRGPLLAHHLGYRPWTLAVGSVLVAGGAVWDWTVLRKLKFPVLAGFPELSRTRPSRLLTDGPYARVRHPRYFGALIGILGLALICNYLWLYVIVAASVPLGGLMIRLEERELRQRFGTEYAEYSRRVPQFIPRFFSRRSG